MAKTPKPETQDDAEQSARFLATAKEREADEKGDAFEAALRVITPVKPARKTTAKSRAKG